MDESEEPRESNNCQRPDRTAFVPELFKEKTQKREVKKRDRKKVTEVIHFRCDRQRFEKGSRVKLQEISEINGRSHEHKGDIGRRISIVKIESQSAEDEEVARQMPDLSKKKKHSFGGGVRLEVPKENNRNYLKVF